VFTKQPNQLNQLKFRKRAGVQNESTQAEQPNDIAAFLETNINEKTKKIGEE